MAWLPALDVIGLAACIGLLIGALVVRGQRRRRVAEAMARLSVPQPRVLLRSQVLVLPTAALDIAEPDHDAEPSMQAYSPSAPSMQGAPWLAEPQANDMQSVHEAPTREFAAHVEDLAALSMQGLPTRELAVHQAKTREFAASEGTSASSGLHARTRLARERREEDATIKVKGGDAEGQRDSTADELLRMLGPSPTPSLGNIEIYYRLGLAYLATNQDAEARRCFLTVEAISPGYRDAALQLAHLPIHVPTLSGPTPVHHALTTSDYVPAQGASNDTERTRGRRNGR